MLEFLNPIDGDVLFSNADGCEQSGILFTNIELKSDSCRKITVNGRKARENNGVYTVTVPLDAYRNALEAHCEETGETKTIYIYWFANGYKTYRMGVDDVIWCFENIWRHQDCYQSIFDDPFLRLFRDLHQQFGTHVHMHIYYETEDGSFNLSMFPDRYKTEFQRNASWLRFTFHARCNLPDSPYQHVPYELVMAEGRQVEREIRRFAGDEVMDMVTSEHFANSDLYGTRAFRALGYRVLDGYFLFDSDGNPMISYYLDAEQTRHAHERDFWVDNKEDIIFVKDDIIINEIPLDCIDDTMDSLSRGPDPCFMYLLIHEQYFYRFYRDYQPDYREKIFRTVRWCQEHGYRSTWISDIALEKKS